SNGSDVNQFARQIDGAKEELGKPCEVGCADAGYADSEELKKIDEQSIKVVVPSQRQALHSKEEKPFSKSHFSYHQEKDWYVCPAGQVLSMWERITTMGRRTTVLASREFVKVV